MVGEVASFVANSRSFAYSPEIEREQRALEWRKKIQEKRKAILSAPNSKSVIAEMGKSKQLTENVNRFNHFTPWPFRWLPHTFSLAGCFHVACASCPHLPQPPPRRPSPLANPYLAS